MYGFPTQTKQETIDSLEMVRQMFATGILQSAYWHLFTMTAHSPVGLEPEKFKVRKKTKGVGSFANNDLEHEDPTGADHEIFGYGLKKSLLNFMHGHGLDYPLQKWFDFPIPKTSIAPDHILQALTDEEYLPSKPGTKWIWIGEKPSVTIQSKSKKGQHWEIAVLTFQTLKDELEIKTDKDKGLWLADFLSTSTKKNDLISYQQILDSYTAAGFGDFELFWDNKPMNTLFKAGLLRL
jgi:hypothetical protein